MQFSVSYNGASVNWPALGVPIAFGDVDGDYDTRR